ncbi:hypothetical protein ACI2K4_02260 [Micromonospora sp. NPDC050397]|uniref:hypothetical protein n=1 Tax=Micromonospora sp. NPDC050397 TaxID=3364279 RepID=UPI00384F31F8
MNGLRKYLPLAGMVAATCVAALLAARRHPAGSVASGLATPARRFAQRWSDRG